MFALIIPHFLQSVRKNLYGIRSIILAWAISLCLCVAIGITLEKILPGFWIVVYSSFFAVLYLIGGLWFGDAPTVWQRPFHSVGAMGVFWLSFLLTFKWPWNEIGWRYYRHGEGYYEIAAIPEYFLTAVLLIVAVFLLVTSVRRGHTAKLLFGVVPILAIIGYSLSGFEGMSVIERGFGFPTLLFNLYVLVLVVGTIAIGIRKEHMGIVNAGMLMLIILIAARFFDSDMGFVARGIAFIGLGIGFLTTNLLLVRRRGTVK
jgi:hypothetical protein